MPNAYKAATVSAAKRRLKVLDYRAAGLSFRAIAGRLEASGEVGATGAPVSVTQVFRDYQRSMKAIVTHCNVSKVEMVALESERLDMLRVSLAAKVVKGDTSAGTLWLRVSESYRKLHGLDKPFQFEEVRPPGLKMDYSRLTLTEMRLLEELLLRAVVEGETEDDDETEDNGEENELFPV